MAAPAVNDVQGGGMAATELLYGLHAVSAALRYEPASIEALWVEQQRRDPRMQELLDLAQQHGITVQFCSKDALERLCPNVRHQGVVARQRLSVRQFHERDVMDLIANAGENPLLLVLDGVQDPHNLGACLRSADAAGVCAVLAPTDRAVGLNATVRKVACGAAESVPFIQVTNLARTLRQLKEQGVWLVGAAGEAERELYSLDLRGPLAIIMGAEEKGLRRLTREECDELVRIPMRGQVESLNVSVATGVLLFEALRQRSIQQVS